MTAVRSAAPKHYLPMEIASTAATTSQQHQNRRSIGQKRSLKLTNHTKIKNTMRFQKTYEQRLTQQSLKIVNLSFTINLKIWMKRSSYTGLFSIVKCLCITRSSWRKSKGKLKKNWQGKKKRWWRNSKKWIRRLKLWKLKRLWKL